MYLIISGVFVGFLVGLVSSYGNAFTDAVLIEPLKAAIDAHLTTAESLELLAISSKFTLIMAYVATGLIVAMFAHLAYSKKLVADRLSSLQYAILMGASLFTSVSYGNTQVSEWAKGLLDPLTMLPAGAVIDRLTSYWGMLGSTFLVSTAGITYLLIDADPANAEIKIVPGGDQLLAMKTADGTDFKFLGWLINSILVLSPIWATLKIPGTQPF